MNAISIVGLEHQYSGNDRPAVAGLDLKVPAGSFFGLLGPNGAGKTTIISILCGSIRPDSGTVKLLGHEWRNASKEIRRKIGLVPQELALYQELNARENLLFFGRMQGMDSSSIAHRVDALIEQFGLGEHRKKPIGTFSGGMKRRVNLMVALLHNPQILVLDEPTVGVDVHSRALINAHLKQLNENGTTMIYTSHQLEETQKLCSRLAFVDHGRLIAEGDTEDLLKDIEGKDLNSLFLELTEEAKHQ